MKKTTLKVALAIFALAGIFSVNAQQKILTVKNQKKNVYPNSETLISPSGEIKCATVEYNEILDSKIKSRLTKEQFEQWVAPKVAQIKADRLSGKMPAVYTIPVVVHVVHNGDALGSNENIDDLQVQSQIQVFNEDFGNLTGTPGDGGEGVDTDIRFCFAQVDPNGNVTNGITHDNLGQASWDSMGDIDANLKPATIWDPTKYLNLWTCNFGGGMAGTLGYAQFPTGSGLPGLDSSCDTSEASSDGVISAYYTFGSRTIYPAGNYSGTQYDKGRTMTHEVGHMLGLRHIWGDSGACTNDDYCADTPDATSANFNCVTADSCPADGLGNDQTQNYMDYSDDSCMHMFTQDQKDRMIAVLLNADRRVGLLNSTVCNPVPSIQFTGTACESTSKNVTEPSGCNAFVDVSIPLEIDMDPLVDATVNFVINGSSTAVLGVDYTIQTTSVVFPGASQTDKDYILRIYNNDFSSVNKTVVIDFTVTTGGTAIANSVRNSYTVNIINDDFAPIAVNNFLLLNEDFENSGWAAYDRDGDGNFFTGGGLTGLSGYGPIVGACAYSETDGGILGSPATYTPDNYIVSPTFTIPVDAVKADFSYVIGAYATANPASTTFKEHYSVYFSTNLTLSVYSDLEEFVLENDREIPAASSELRSHSLLPYVGQTGYLVIRHHNTAGKGLLLLDTAKVDVDVTREPQTALNTGTPDNVYLPSSGTVYTSNPSDNKVMVDISNNNNVDYGCIDVSVSRATGASVMYQVAGSANYVMGKTFTINPAITQASGNATVKFYFTETEIAEWESTTGNNRNELAIIKSNGETILASLQSFNTNGAYELTHSLSATFSTGISATYYFGKMEAVLGVDQSELNIIGLYPNPSNGIISLSVDTNNDVETTLYDIRGRKVYSKLHANNSDIFVSKLDFSTMASGVYMLNVQSGSKRVVKKVVIQ